MDCRVALPLASSPGVNAVTGNRLDKTSGATEVETMLAQSQPRFFATIGELDWYSGSHHRWIEELDLRSDDRVLEIGCATGILTPHLVDSGLDVTGIDRSRKMINRARRDHPGLNFHVGDATRLPYDDDTFDAVVAASVVNVVDDAKPVLSEMHRVCVPGGTVSVLVPSTSFTGEDLDVLIETRDLTGFSEAALTKWHRGPPKMGRSQLDTLLRGVGLEPGVFRSYLDGMLIAATATVRSD